MASGFDERMSSLLSAIDKAGGGAEGRKKSPLEEVKESYLERGPVDLDEPRHPRSPRQKGAETSPQYRRQDYRDREDHDRERAGYKGRDNQRHHEDTRDRKRYGNESNRRRNDYRTKHQPAPDYVKNPSKWKKYDLSHDGTEGLKRSGMTDDQVNSFAAFQFLRELRERKERERAAAAGEEEEVEMDSRGERKVVFRKTARRKQSGTTREDKDLTFQDSASSKTDQPKKVLVGGAGAGVGVVKMAEYVVGGEEGGARSRRLKKKQLQALGGDKGNKTETSRTTGQGSQSCVSLSHLDELDEED